MLPVLLLLPLVSLVQGTERPVIGVLAQETYDYPHYRSYIAASYVKAVEQAGARVVPILINQTQEYYRNVLSSLNGALLPGGSATFLRKGGYADAGRIIINYAKEANTRGEHFPVLAICLGLQLLFFLDVESYNILGFCKSVNVALPLNFKQEFSQSKLYHNIPTHTLNMLEYLPVTYNHHKRCVTEELIKHFNLQHKWKVLSTNTDFNGSVFISSVESTQYPFVGLQFHPEKNAFEWKPSLKIPHSQEAILSSRYFFDWFVGEARKSSHSFRDPKAESDALIYNYNITYTGSKGGYFEQIYLFKKISDDL